MDRLKKVILSLLIPLLLIGCERSKNNLSEWMEENGKIKILSTTAQIGDLVAEIGGERIDSWVLIQGDLDPHSYEIVKGDQEKLERAQLIFYNGLGLEHGAALSSFLHRSLKSIPIGEKIQEAHPDKILKKGEMTDPHIWMDISLWEKGVDPIVEALSTLDPEGAEIYKKRGAFLSEKMEKTHQKLIDDLQKIPSEKRYLVTSHDAFHYFTRSYLASAHEKNWEERFAAPEGLAPEGQLNPRELQKIIAYLKQKNVCVVFPESNVSRDSIRKIVEASQEMGLAIRICEEPLYGDAMNGLHYLEMMEHNANTIVKHL